ncbi:MAG: hypothetical protein Q8O42_04970 [Acidobacteriota bacterium]|nr:hypothetical protein [Acidobacteriota bacterium]
MFGDLRVKSQTGGRSRDGGARAEFATLDWVDWFNMRRLLGPIGDVPPAEFEANYYQQAAVA